ncbi:MAG: phosphoglycerate kinase [Candidatus Thalassarchaeum sp.]
MAIEGPLVPPNVTTVLSLDDVCLSGRTVLYRVDVNSPLDPSTGAFLDDSRLRSILETLSDLSDSKIVIMGHQSRPGKIDFTDMSGHCDRLSRLIGQQIQFVEDVCGEEAIAAIEVMQPGDKVFLDNVRMHPEEYGENKVKAEDEPSSEVVTRLSSVADAYVTDAFGAAHRNSPTLTGFAEEIPCIAGRLMNKEIRSLELAVNDPPRPYVAILGGAKCDDSLRVALNLIDRKIVDSIVMVGVVGNLMLWTSGHDIGRANKEAIKAMMGDGFEPTWQMAERLVKEHSALLFLPRDVAVEVDGKRHQLELQELPTEYPIYDIGIETLQDLKLLLNGANCILWNGPASYFEKPEFAFGTIEILNMCAEATGVTIVGGGHTSALVNQRGLAGEFSHNSTGGGSALGMLSGDPMPVIDSLSKSNDKFRPLLGALGLDEEE